MKHFVWASIFCVAAVGCAGGNGGDRAVVGGEHGGGAARDPNAPLTCNGRVQAAGQSDYDFAKACVQFDLNGVSLADSGYGREQDRLDEAYERRLYAVFDAVAARRGVSATAFKLHFQREQLAAVEGEISRHEANMPSASSKLWSDEAIRSSTRAAIRDAERRRDAIRDKVRALGG